MEQVLYKLPDGWEWRTFNDVCTNITDGAHASPKTVDEGFPYVTVRDVNNKGQIDIINCKRISEDDFLSLKKGNCLPPVDSVLLSKDGTVGKVAHVTNDYDEFVVLSSLAIIVPEKAYLSPEYLKYFLLSPEFQDHAISSKTGAAIKRIVLRTIKNFNIPIAPLEQQKRIVEKLDALLTRIDTAIEHLQESITLADALLKSSLSSMLTRQEHWDKVRLNDVCQITSKLCDPREEQYLDMFHIGGANITSFSGELIDLKTARDEKLISGKFPFDNSMVLYSKIRPYLMKVARPTISGICSADIYPLTPDKKRMTRDFLFYLLLSEQFTQYAIEGSSRAGMPKVNRNHLFNFEFHLPSIDEQRSICNSLDSLVKKTNEMSKELASKLSFLTGLRASILDSAFKGEL
ncbi:MULTISPECIES: restriction endonuclease subunit S [Shewanella]|uniref:restriction endonuclease subunit S n=1 Tax=Shewanella TaxID=22 RepID=UPI003005B9E8